MVGNFETFGARDIVLALLDFRVKKLLNSAAIQAYQVVMVLAFVEFIHRLATFKLAACEQAGLLKLHQYTVNGGQADVGALIKHQPVDIFCAHMALTAFLEQFQNGDARQSGFQAGIFQIADGLHMNLSQPRECKRTPRYNGLIIACLFPLMTPNLPLTTRSCGLFFIVCLAACSFVVDPASRAMKKMTPYRIEVVQGNFVSKEQLQSLRPGMTRKQVKEILGTPLIASLFHADRWDYVFTIKRQGTAPQQRKLSVFFKGDLFERVESEELPSESEFAEKLTTSRAENIKVPELKASEQDLEKFRKSTPASSVTEAPAEVSGPAKTYPPLDPKSP